MEKANNSAFDNLSEEDKISLTEKATKILVKEKQDAGEQDFKITEQETKAKVIELMNEDKGDLANKNPKEKYKEVDVENNRIKQNIATLFEKAKTVKDRVIKEVIKKVSKNEVEKIKEVTGIEINENYKHVIDNSSINHVINEHGEGNERQKDQIPITKKDFELIPDILNNYDGIEKSDKERKGNQPEVIIYKKTFDDGTTYYLEEVRTGKEELTLKTMYKKRGDAKMLKASKLNVQNDPLNANIQKNNKTKGKEFNKKEYNTLVKTKQKAVLDFLESEGYTKEEYQNLPQKDRNKLNDEFENSEYNSKLNQDGTNSKLEEFEDRRDKVKIWANGIIEKEINKGKITAKEVIEKLNDYDIPIPKNIQELASKETQIDYSNIKPIGKGVFGNIYDQFKGKAKQAVEFLLKKKEGEAVGVFHRESLGDIDLPYGSHTDKYGLEHIVDKHVKEQNDFNSVDEAVSVIDDVVTNGEIKRENHDKAIIDKNGYRVVVNKNVRDNKGNVINTKNWIVTGFDTTRSAKEKASSRKTLTTPLSNQQADGVTLPTNDAFKENTSATTRATPDSNKGSRAVASEDVSTANIQNKSQIAYTEIQKLAKELANIDANTQEGKAKIKDLQRKAKEILDTVSIEDIKQEAKEHSKKYQALSDAFKEAGKKLDADPKNRDLKKKEREAGQELDNWANKNSAFNKLLKWKGDKGIIVAGKFTEFKGDNETQTQGDTKTDKDVQPNIEQGAEKRTDENIQSAPNTKANTKPTKVKRLQQVAKKKFNGLVERLKKAFPKNKVITNKSELQKFLDETGYEYDSKGEEKRADREKGIAEAKKAIKRIQQKTNNKTKVVFVTNSKQLPDAIKNDPDYSDNWKAVWYGEKNETPTIYFNANIVNSEQTAIDTWIHEAGLHGGLRILIPNRLIRNDLMKKVYDSAKKIAETNPKYKDLLEFIDKNYTDKTVKGEEVLAYLSERIIKGEDLQPAEKSLWQEIVALINKVLNKNYGKTLTEKELATIIQASVQSNFSSNKRGKKGVRFSKEKASSKILTAFKDAVSGKLTGKPITIGDLTQEGRKYLQELSGLTFKENISFVLNPSELKHIYNDHYGNNEKDKGSNIPLTDADIKNMADVISNPDAVVFLGYDKKTQSNKFSFLKENNNGAYNLLEVYSGRKGNLTAKTFFNTKKGVAQRVMDLQKSLLSTSETYFGTNPLNTKVPLLFENSKSEVRFAKKRLRDNREIEFVRGYQKSKIAKSVNKGLEKRGLSTMSHTARTGSIYLDTVGTINGVDISLKIRLSNHTKPEYDVNISELESVIINEIEKGEIDFEIDAVNEKYLSGDILAIVDDYVNIVDKFYNSNYKTTYNGNSRKEVIENILSKSNVEQNEANTILAEKLYLKTDAYKREKQELDKKIDEVREKQKELDKERKVVYDEIVEKYAKQGMLFTNEFNRYPNFDIYDITNDELKGSRAKGKRKRLKEQARSEYQNRTKALRVSDVRFSKQTQADISLQDHYQRNADRLPYTLNVFNSNDFKAMQGKNVKPITVKQLLNKSGIKQIEKDLINDVLDNNYNANNRVSYDEIEATVRANIMPLEPIVTNTYATYGMDNLGGDYGNANTVILNSPIEHGKTGHFGGDFKADNRQNITYVPKQLDGNTWVAVQEGYEQNANEENIYQYVGTAGSKADVEQWIANYKGGKDVNKGMFGHLRTWRKGDVMYISEVQSDYFQKNNPRKQILESRDDYKALAKETDAKLKQAKDNKAEEKAIYKEFNKRVEKEILPKLTKDEKQFIASQKTFEKRLIQEALKYAKDEGATKVRFPYPHTLATIEGYIANEDGSEIVGDVNNVGDDFLYNGYRWVTLEILNDNEVKAVPLDAVKIVSKKKLLSEAVDDLYYTYFNKYTFTEENHNEFLNNTNIDFNKVNDYLNDKFEEATENEIEIDEEEIKEALFNDFEYDFDDVEDYIGQYDNISQSDDGEFFYATNYNPETISIGNKNTNKEDFKVEDLSDTQQTVLKKYEELTNTLPEYVKGEVEQIEDDNGFDWHEVEITEADRQTPVVAFSKQDPTFNNTDFNENGEVKAEVLAEIEAEKKQIRFNAIDNGTYMKAPNGKPTKLTKEQWVLVRTKRFKKWFGDWEKSARIEKLRNADDVVITEKDYKGKYELNRDDAKAYLKNNLRGEYVNKDTGDKVDLVRVGVNKITSHDERNDGHLKSIVAIPQLIENAIFIDELSNEKGSNKFDSYRYYVAGLKIDGEDYTARLTIGVKRGKFYYDHTLTEIEKGTLIDSVNRQAKSDGNKKNPLSENKDTKLISILQNDASKVTDENGEPLESGNIRFQIIGEKGAKTTESKQKNAPRYLKDKKGEVYGAVFPDGTIYLDENKANFNTPIHEFAHVWIDTLKGANKELHNTGIRLIKKSKYYKDLKKDKNYKHLTDEQIVEEALATAIGDKGEHFWSTQKKTYTPFMNWLNKFKGWLTDKFFINQKQNIENLTLDQFLDASLHDLLGGEEIEINNNSNEKETSETGEQVLDTEALVEKMTENAEAFEEKELTIANWFAEFGKDGKVKTPIGEVKMGDNQFTKLDGKDRGSQFSMIKPTLENPDVIIEDKSSAKEGDVAERDSSYVFVKAFKNIDGSKSYFFTSVTVKKGNNEVVVSNHKKRDKQVINLIEKGKVLYKATGLNDSNQPFPEHNPKTDNVGVSDTNIQNSFDSEKSALKKGSETLQSLDEKLKALEDKLNQFGKESLSMGLPIIVAKGMINAMRLATKTAKTTLDVLEAGRKYITSTDWYKNLSKNEQLAVEKMLQDENSVFNNMDKIIDDAVEKAREEDAKTIKSLKSLQKKTAGILKRVQTRGANIDFLRKKLERYIKEVIDSKNIVKRNISTFERFNNSTSQQLTTPYP